VGEEYGSYRYSCIFIILINTYEFSIRNFTKSHPVGATFMLSNNADKANGGAFGENANSYNQVIDGYSCRCQGSAFGAKSHVGFVESGT
jgi:hypothetical protein